eukprot:TRINITY_DN9830_c0_g1_i1.p2 TRINITY_DN9830_c0_g1~~TRINITY_DN9830_c0_g1_i1.p2  ORF type:complete len:124 (-),score=27.83 TRINITY_DN9830_c0_g1_i1:418-789(-)
MIDQSTPWAQRRRFCLCTCGTAQRRRRGLHTGACAAATASAPAAALEGGSDGKHCGAAAVMGAPDERTPAWAEAAVEAAVAVQATYLPPPCHDVAALGDTAASVAASLHVCPWRRSSAQPAVK